MTINEFFATVNNCKFLKATVLDGRIRYVGDNLVRPRVVCNDGFTISVQANECAYCTPRISQGLADGKLYFKGTFNFDRDVAYGFIDEFIPYVEVELGYPSEVEEDLLPYAEDESDPTNTVYGYVPVEIVDSMIQRHGGINENAVLRKEKENA